MLLPLNALDFLVQSSVFIKHINDYNINPDAINEISIKHYRSEKHGHLFEIYFDYGNEGESKKDFIADIKIIGHNEFEIL